MTNSPSAAEKVVNDKLTQLHLQKQEQSLREKLGVVPLAGSPQADAA